MLMTLPRQLASLVFSALLFSLGVSTQASPQGPVGELRPDAKRAQKAVEQGDQFEAVGQLDEAVEAYTEAARYAPQDTEVVEHSAALRSRVVRQHVEAAERDALAGHVDRATEELSKALRLDPGNTIVAERLSQMKSMDTEPQEKSPSEIVGLPRLWPRTGKHNLNLRGDTKTVYQQLAAEYGVRVEFDPDLTMRNVTLRLEDVDFYTAATVLGAETATFWRPLTAAMMFVTADTQEKRRQYGLEAEQTFPLASSLSPEEATEMLRVLRDITAATRIQVDTHSHTMTMRDTPVKLALAGKMLGQIDRARGEVMLEIELLEVDKNKARELGITPPATEQLIPLTTSELNALKKSTDLNNLLTNLQQIFSAQGISNVSSVIPVGGGLTTFLLTLPSAVANFSDTLSLVQSGRQVLLRAQDNKPATFFVGDRYPITLSLLSGSLGKGSAVTSLTGALAGVNFPETQFSVNLHPSALVANNFTGHTLPDLAVVFNDPNVNTLTILQNQDSGNFVQLSTTPPPFTFGKNETGQVALGTGVFRNDTAKFTTAQPDDLVVVNSTSNNISILLGNADPTTGQANGTFTASVQSPIAVGMNPSAVVVADFNGDGFLDLAVANQGDNSISLFRGDGSGNFTQFPGSPFKLRNTSTVSEKGPVAMVSANFRRQIISPTNGASEVDLAIVNESSNNVTILLSSVDQNGNVTFTEAPQSPIAVGNLPVAIATADLNADGVPALGVVNQNDN